MPSPSTLAQVLPVLLVLLVALGVFATIMAGASVLRFLGFCLVAVPLMIVLGALTS